MSGKSDPSFLLVTMLGSPPALVDRTTLDEYKQADGGLLMIVDLRARVTFFKGEWSELYAREKTLDPNGKGTHA